MPNTLSSSKETSSTINCLHICNDFLGSNVHAQLYNEFNSLGVEQSVYYTLKPHLIDKSKKTHGQWSYEVIPSSLTTKKHSYIYEWKINFLYKDIVNKLDLKKIDLITATTLFNDGGIALKLYKDFSIPYVVAIRSTDMDVYLKYRPDLALLAFKIIKNAKQVIFVSDSLKKKFKNHFLIKTFFSKFENKTSVIYNGIDDFWFKERTEPKHLSSPLKIIFIGRLILRKNIFSLCEAVKELNRSGVEAMLTIIGDGDLEKEVIDISLQNPEIIKYIGAVKDKQTLKTHYKDHHIFAMPSLGETFGLVYIEALSQKLPVLYVKGEAIDGIFEQPIGQACEPNWEGIFKALLEIFENYNRLTSDEIDLNQFKWSHIGNTYYKMFQKYI